MSSLLIDLRIWRVTWGLTQQEAADWCGVSVSSWKRYERGLTVPDDDRYEMLRELVSRPPQREAYHPKHRGPVVLDDHPF